MQTAGAISAFLVAISLALPAAAGPSFSKKEVRKLLIGNTYPLGRNNEGAMYVKPDGTMDVVWEGKTETTAYKLRSRGRICYELKMFGETECIGFEKIDGESFYQVFGDAKRKMAFSDIKPGKAF
ncbi:MULTISPECIES: hypothetical protein [Phaeobacter]|uniref:Uncharacterized protein n=1 Tax=Phaeobacter piscinae TaxID=1580596 RepID=A0ABM6PEY9_9RHOB|nr:MULTISPECIES: hypothetical protein [Phaeobacter]ATG36151.1 hypothetical protein PhaeoP36_02018 [Phaeobacter piscinae]AUQ86672.1 hypothetical protein PhaeoP42_02019 [Phaeobacter piscinae]AUR24555.1 hypothetical protein PhaeoP23_02018 [Phaeobacter piscinae]KII14793.1 hypothetical protein OO25_10390 [Phaeobacter sp. S60]UTS81063.1 hypothetical protein OL67_002139 [Phaeobacter piscinae]